MKIEICLCHAQVVAGPKHAKKALFWSTGMYFDSKINHTVWATFFCSRLAIHLYFFQEETDGSKLAMPEQTEVDKYRHSISRTRTLCHLLFCAARLQYAKSTTIPNSTLTRQKSV